MDFLQSAVADDLGAFLGFFLGFERTGLSFLSALADRGNAVGNDNGNQNADRFIPFRLVEEKEHYLHHQRDKQDHDHRVFKAL